MANCVYFEKVCIFFRLLCVLNIYYSLRKHSQYMRCIALNEFSKVMFLFPLIPTKLNGFCKIEMSV